VAADPGSGMQLVSTFAPVVLLLVLLVGVAVLRVQGTIEASRAIVEGMDPTLRRIGAACLVFTVGVAIALVGAGLELPAAVAVAMVTGLGSVSLVCGVFGAQGLLVETDTQRLLRRRAGAPIASSRAGRILAITLGLVPFVGWIAWSLPV
jgi:hypothetical protein